MDLAAVKEGVSRWPIAERQDLIEGVWDDIVASGRVPNLTPAQEAEIDRRVAWLGANPDNAGWSEIRRSTAGARGRYACRLVSSGNNMKEIFTCCGISYSMW